MTSLPPEGRNSHKVKVRPRRLWFVVAGAVWVALVLLWPRLKSVFDTTSSSDAARVGGRSGAAAELPLAVRRFAVARSGAKSAVEIVAEKVRQFGRSRRAIAERIAARRKEGLPPEVDAFFKAIDKGDWDEIQRRWKEILAHQTNHDRPDLEAYFSAVMDTYGVAEQTHQWPAQKLLDYGNAILDSLRPGMVYVGGTDCGRFVPELLSATSDDPHMVITQNALAAPSYLDFLNELYGGRFNALSPEDSARAFQDYTADAQKRFQHDLDFPDEPKQVLPGENIKVVDGKVQVSGQVSVMGINERLLQMLMEKNPELSFATEESFAMRGTYADAVPLGPLMELNAQGDQGTFNGEQAAQSVDYWRSTAQALLADPEASGSDYTRLAYSKDINSTANLLAAHNFTSEAADAYRLASQVWPGNAEPVEGLARVLVQTGHADQAKTVLDNFASKHPEQRGAVQQASAAILWTATVTGK